MNFFVVILTTYVIGALIIELFFKLSYEVSHMLAMIDDIICVFFLTEFFISFYKAKDKLAFMKWGWIDLLSSIPVYHFLEAGPALAAARLFRIFRAYRSIHILIKYVFQNKVKGTFTTAALFAVMCLIFASIAILQVEHAPNSNIKTAEDALWWSLVTITTVGYGDLYPVTTAGRLIGAALIIVGVAMFGIFAGYVASWFTHIGHGSTTVKETETVTFTEDQVITERETITERIKEPV